MASGNCIVNVGVGHWYPEGSKRLEKSLRDNGYNDALLFFDKLPEGSPTHEENPYAFKVYAILHAIYAGYKNIAWIDSSIYCVRDPYSLFIKIDEQGYYFVENGYYAGQETNDNCLNYFKVSRDEAMKIQQISSGFFGIDITKNKYIINLWNDAMAAGAFKGKREDNKEESQDPRFLHHRQDQSALSLVITRANPIIDKLGNLFDYKISGKDCNFLSQGM